jgi:hypothetical protein
MYRVLWKQVVQFLRSRRSRPLLSAAVVLSLAGWLPRAAAAQSPGEPPARRRAIDVGAFVGAARHSLAGTHLGLIPDRNHVFASLQLAIEIVGNRLLRVAYAPQLLPLVVVTNNPTDQTVRLAGGGTFIVEGPPSPVLGVGVAPISVEAQLCPQRRICVYGGGAAGAVWFGRAVPVRDARAFNYTFEFGGGLRWKYASVHSLVVGYKFHHLSNAYTARENPGLDAAVLVVGYTRELGSHRR